MTGRRAKVLIVQERLPHYRVPFFDQLRRLLAAGGITLLVAHGRGNATMKARGDEVELPWAKVVDNRLIGPAGRTLLWQPVLSLASRADLVVVEQATRLAVNYSLLARQALGGSRIAFWGHGANLQADGSWSGRLSETAKRRYSMLPHWWFAYTEGSARRVEALGFPARRISIVQNALDTSFIKDTTSERDPSRAVFVGGLYPNKRLDLLFATADLVAAAMPSFRLVVAGDGPLRGHVEREAAVRSHVEYVGPRFGKELASELKSASVMLMPGAVGLAVLDAFAAGLPVVSSSGMGHGPELEYLVNGVNSVIAEPTAESLAAATRLGMSPSRRQDFDRACAETTERISLGHMVERFADGVERALGQRGILP